MGQSPEKQNLPRASHPGLSQQLGQGAGVHHSDSRRRPDQGLSQGQQQPRARQLCTREVEPDSPGRRAGWGKPANETGAVLAGPVATASSPLLPPPLFQAWVVSLSGAISAGSTPASGPSPASAEPPPLAPAACLPMPLAISRRHATGSS